MRDGFKSRALLLAAFLILSGRGASGQSSGAGTTIHGSGQSARATVAEDAGVKASAATAALSTAQDGATQELIIIDTDIGDDIDDAFAIALALESPEAKILGITTAWGNTPLRARVTRRFLRDTGHADIPVAIGQEKYPAKGTLNFSQARYAEREPEAKLPAAVDFLLEQIRQHPGEITLVAIGPETNLGAAIDRDAQTFKKLKRVVLMGGSIYRGYDGLAYPLGPTKATPEWNILCDVEAARKVFASGVPLYVMPLDSTQVKLEELERARLFSRGTPMTDSLAVLYHQWAYETRQVTPTLFDVIAMGYAIRPELCPMKKMRLSVAEDGSTKVVEGEANAEVCLASDSEAFLKFYLGRVGEEVRK
jgi:purine nucleosidase